MAAFLTDDEIPRLSAERKPLPEDYRSRIQIRPKRGHSERELPVRGEQDHEFMLILRQANLNALDFSVILCYCVPGTNQLFRLRRYNGRHEHTNKLEGYTFYDFHIRTATERYQESGLREDSFAEPTDRYCDFSSAIRCMLDDCGFDAPDEPQEVMEGFEP